MPKLLIQRINELTLIRSIFGASYPITPLHVCTTIGNLRPYSIYLNMIHMYIF